LIYGEICYVHPASYASTLDDAPQVRCYGHGWSTTVGAEDMMKCSRNPSQGGDVAGVGLLLVVCPALMSPVNPSADPVPQLPKRVWSAPYHALSHRVRLVGRSKEEIDPIQSSSALIF